MQEPGNQGVYVSDTKYNKDAAIAAQNAGSTAAALLGHILPFADVGDVQEAIDLFSLLRTEVFNGTLALGGAEAFVEAVESSPQPQRSGGRSTAPRRQSSGGGGAGNSADPMGVAMNFGKHKGMTMGEIWSLGEDGESYIQWLADNAENPFIARIAGEVLAQAA